VVPEKRKRGTRIETKLPKRILSVNVPGRVDTWGDWNSFFADTLTRTYSAVFERAHLDTLPGGRLVFTPSGQSRDRAVVSAIFCRIDSVREVVKYTFPGQSVNFSVGPGFVGSVFLSCTLSPKESRIRLALLNPQQKPTYYESGRTPNQVIIFLQSRPGCAYTLRTGVECTQEGEPGSITTYYSRPKQVVFPRMIRFETLLPEAGDTVFIVSNNPKAIKDLAKAIPHGVVYAVLVPVTAVSEGEELEKEQLPNLHLHISSIGDLDESFVVLGGSLALIEEKKLDPDFTAIARLCLKESEMNRMGYPRLTRMVRGKSVVIRLMSRYQEYAIGEPQDGTGAEP
jgi:hypothetical protein